MSCLNCLKRQASDCRAPAAANGEPSSRPAPDDPRIPLNARQRFTLVKNWKGISREAAATGANMFVRMFAANPELWELFGFGALRDEPLETQLEDESLLEHGEAVMAVFDEAVRAVDRPDDFFATLRQYGQAHACRRGFRPEHFHLMEEPFLHAVKTTLDERFTENMEQVYKVVIKLILDTMTAECRAAVDKGA